MSRKILLFSLLILLGGGRLFSQTADSTGLGQYQSALDRLVLLRNQNNRLPLQRLDTLRIAFVPSGQTALMTFVDYLERYTTIEGVKLPASGEAGSPQEWARLQREKFNFFIIGIPDENGADRAPTYLVDRPYLQALMRQAPAAVVVFNPQKSLREMPEIGQAAILIAAGDDYYSQSLAAQLIFGGTTTTARLGQDWGAGFPAGSGMDAPAAVRLGYAPPEAVGMNAQLLNDSIRAILEAGIQAGAFPGAQVLVAKDGKVVYHQAFGNHTYSGGRAVMTTDLYDFASVTKISTGLPVLMKWYGEGRLDLDGPLVKYLPEVKGSNKADLRMRDILAHQARLMAFIPFWRGTLKGNSRYPWQKHWNGQRANDFRFKARSFHIDSSRAYHIYVTDSLWMHDKYYKKIYGSIYKSPLNAKPGYVYSDFFFMTMPRVVKAQTGMPFENYIKDNFYKKLGANTLTFNPLRFFPAERIIPTEHDTFFRMKVMHGTVHDEAAAMLGGVSGHAGLFGTANDLAKLMTMYLNYGEYGGERFIATEAVKEFARCQFCPDNFRGLGFDKPRVTYPPNGALYAKDASPNSFGHSGYTGTFTWVDPDSKLLLVFFTNRVYPTRMNNLISELRMRPRVHQVLYDAMKGVGNRE